MTQPEKSHIPFEGVAPELIGSLRVALAQLESVRGDISTKIERMNGWRTQIDDLASTLKNKPDCTELNKGIDDYTQLLAKVFLEVSLEFDAMAPYVEADPPSSIPVTADDARLTASEFVAFKIDSMKRAAKAVQRDLQVSFSRYEYGLGAQVRRLQFVISRA